ncbi:hypothetical protein GobsT_15410 [Gemmata obscuriglobus]|nr:hypothetical protein GobsT_15410 [Gemmata obscuriglobus]VTS02672.1 Uncharacterized protein OS=Blastopirellula marina DSM 3645 GN=DSM3645_10552 PE=4 SV=1: SBP_bac_10 [Gemmata obscuriglobus UQM 2246]
MAGGVMSRSARRGLSLVEVLVAIAIVVILIGLLMPATRRIHEAAGRVKCQNNFKHLILGLHNAHDVSSSVPMLPWVNRRSEPSFPPGCFGPGAAPEERLSWMVALLPHVEQESQGALYRRFDREKGYAANLPAGQTSVTAFICPSSQEATTVAGLTNYVAMAGLGSEAASRPAGAAGNGFMGYDRVTPISMIKDGTSNTIALTETRVGLGPWARGGPSNLRGFESAEFLNHAEGRSRSNVPHGMNVGMADGSVRFIGPWTDPKKLVAAITIAGGETTELD